MASLSTYVRGPQVLVSMPVDSSSADIAVGDFVSLATAGYIQQASAGELPVGVAMDAVASPSADGDVSILVDVSPSSVFEFAPDAGTVTQALVGVTMDVGGARTVNIDASADDCLVCVGVDTDNNKLSVMRIQSACYAGVV